MTLHSTVEAAALAGVTFRKVDYWCRIGAIAPAVESTGAGYPRAWSDEDIVALTAMGQVAHAIAHDNIGDVYRRVGEDARRSNVARVDIGHGVSIAVRPVSTEQAVSA